MGTTRDWKNRPVSLFIGEPYVRFSNFHQEMRSHATSKLHQTNVEKITELYGNGWMEIGKRISR